MTSTSGNYYLGVDLGTTYAAAGILRQGRPEVVTLGDRSPVVPSVLYFKEDGGVLTGDPANRRGLMDPSRVVREFKRRVGDSTPMVVGQTPYSADTLLAKLLRFVYDEVVKRQGSAPSGITVTHPANWGSYKIDVLGQAVRMADVGPVDMITEPVAAAIHYASTERMDPGQAVAVYDLGGGTFDAAVVRKTVSSADGSGGGSFELLGDVEGIERLGGIDLDEAIFQHVVRWCESAFSELDIDDPTTLQAVARIRQECVAAKEALSADTDVAIPVVLPNLQTEVRLTRGEFEAMVRPLIQQTVEALRRAIRSANVDITNLAAVLLVGGSSQVPLVTEMVGADLGRPIAVDQHPKHTVALGAAIAAGPNQEIAAPAIQPVVRTEPILAVAPVASSSGPVSDPRSPTMVMPQAAQRAEPAQAAPRAEPAQAAPRAEPTQAAPASFNRAQIREVPAGAPDGHGRGGGGGNFSASPPPTGGSNKVPLLVGAVVAAVVALGGLAWVMANRSDTETATDATEAAPTTPTSSQNSTTASTEVAAPSTSTESTVDTENTENTVNTESTEGTVSTSTSTTAATSTTAEAPPGLTASITDVAIDGGSYAVSYSASFSPLISSDPASTHLHFFFDTVPVTQAGSPGGGPWILYDGPSPFTGYGPNDRPAGATQICVTPANHAHEVVDTGIYHCVSLPES